jgi:hypothetical protein
MKAWIGQFCAVGVVVEFFIAGPMGQLVQIEAQKALIPRSPRHTSAYHVCSVVRLMVANISPTPANLMLGLRVSLPRRREKMMSRHWPSFWNMKTFDLLG